MITVPIIKTQRTMLTLLQHYDYQLIIDYYQKNSAHLAPWEPQGELDYFSKPQVRRRLLESNDLFAVGGAVHFAAFALDESGEEIKSELIGVCHFSNIIRGSFQACNLGYSIAAEYQGKGLMKEILTAGIDYIFTELKLHRIMANYIPINIRSGQLLSSLGFDEEGVAKSYLKIAGQWQDHRLTSKINPEHSD